jgi:hypothetical protein
MAKFYQLKKPAVQSYNPGDQWILEKDHVKMTFDSKEKLVNFAKEAGIDLEEISPPNNQKKTIKLYLNNFN